MKKIALFVFFNSTILFLGATQDLQQGWHHIISTIKNVSQDKEVVRHLSDAEGSLQKAFQVASKRIKGNVSPDEKNILQSVAKKLRELLTLFQDLVKKNDEVEKVAIQNRIQLTTQEIMILCLPAMHYLQTNATRQATPINTDVIAHFMQSRASKILEIIEKELQS